MKTALALLFVLVTTVRAVDWPQFRGPTGDGHYVGAPLPIEWGPQRNCVWAANVPGRGWSSPVVYRGRVYLTTAVESDNSYSLRALALDATTGSILWNNEVFRKDASKSPKGHSKNSHASPTPVADGERLYIHFGHLGTACLTLNGDAIWRNAEIEYAPVHGNGGSPVLHNDKLIFSCDGSDKQFVVALDASTGAVAWNTPRGTSPSRGFSFATPHVIDVEGRPHLLSPGSDRLGAYDPATGKELWHFDYRGYSLIQRPVFGHGLVYIQTGYDTPFLHAVRPVSGESVWSHRKAVPNTPSYLLTGDDLLMVSDKGIATCLDAKTGKVHYTERLPTSGFSASPIYDNGKAFIISEDGLGLVLRTGPKFEVLAQNPLKERALASFAAADGALFVRTDTHLYRFEAK